MEIRFRTSCEIIFGISFSILRGILSSILLRIPRGIPKETLPEVLFRDSCRDSPRDSTLYFSINFSWAFFRDFFSYWYLPRYFQDFFFSILPWIPSVISAGSSYRILSRNLPVFSFGISLEMFSGIWQGFLQDYIWNFVAISSRIPPGLLLDFLSRFLQG